MRWCVKKAHFSIFAETLKGRKNINQDSFGIRTGIQAYISKQKSKETYRIKSAFDECVAVVSDGVSCCPDSQLVADKVVKYVLDNSNEPNFVEGLNSLNNEIYEEFNWNGAATVVAATIKDRMLKVINAGDSSAHLMRNNSLFRMSERHTFRAVDMIDKWINANCADEYSNILTEFLGKDEPINLNISEMPVYKDDVIILASDGVPIDEMDKGKLSELLQARNPASAIIRYTKDRCFDLDDMTIVVIRIRR